MNVGAPYPYYVKESPELAVAEFLEEFNAPRPPVPPRSQRYLTESPIDKVEETTTEASTSIFDPLKAVPGLIWDSWARYLTDAVFNGGDVDRDSKKKKGIEFKILNKLTDKLTETAAEYIANKILGDGDDKSGEKGDEEDDRMLHGDNQYLEENFNKLMDDLANQI